MKFQLISAAIVLAVTAFTGNALADVKVKSKTTASGQSYENTTYIKGKRQRTEAMNGMSINLTQCDLRRGIQINPASQTYMVSLFEQATASAQNVSNAKSDGVVRAGGTVTSTVTIKDTGERKQMFGYTARHLIITTEMASSPDACSVTNMKMQTDGWYIDTEFALDCDYGSGYAASYSAKQGCRDKYVSKQVGAGKRGFPVYEKMTMFDESGKESFSTVNEVIEFSRATLDPSLFEVPAGYREVKDAQEMYASAAASYMSGVKGSSNSSNSSMSSSITAAAAKPVEAASASTVGPKKAGTVRIGLAGVRTGAVGESVSAADLALAIRNTLVEYLKVPNVEVVALDAKLPSAIDAEAKEKDCDLVLNATASHKKGGGGFGGLGGLGSALGSAIAHTPLGSTGSTAGNIAVGTARNSAINAAHVAGSIKAKDELTLDIKLTGSANLAKQFKAKAKSAGDDIISNVVEQAAQAVVTAIGK
jgi:hypothetical protein